MRRFIKRGLAAGLLMGAAMSVALAADGPVAAPDLKHAIDAMPEGGVLLLEGGDWGELELRNLSWPEGSPLVLRAADPSDPPRFSKGLIADIEGLVIEGATIDYVFEPGNESHLRIFRVEGSRNIAIRNMVFDGDDARGVGSTDDGFPTAYAVSIQNSSNVVFEGNEIRGFYRGLVVRGTQDLDVRGNDLHHLRMDGMNFAQVERVLIESNHIHDFDRSMESKDHADMIQFWTNQTEAPTRDVVIRGNILNSGAGWFTQSIFMRNDLVDRGLAGPEMFYRNVTIENNFILNAHLHGITVGETQGLKIRNNTVVRNSSSEGPQDNPRLYTPQIRVASASRDVEIARNVVFKVVGEEGQADWRVQDNLLVQDTGRMLPNFYGTVFVGGDPTQPGSFGAKPGGALDGTGLGAPPG